MGATLRRHRYPGARILKAGIDREKEGWRKRERRVVKEKRWDIMIAFWGLRIWVKGFRFKSLIEAPVFWARPASTAERRDRE